MLPVKRNDIKNIKSGQDEKAVEVDIEAGVKQVDSLQKQESRGKQGALATISGDYDSRVYRDFAALPPPVVSTSESKDSQDKTPMRYRKLPAKLSEMLSRPEYSSIIAWMPHGRSWKIHDADGFVGQVIPEYFDYQNFNSFIRLVNAWGFRRMTKGHDRNSYYHELFLEDRPDLHRVMRRMGIKEKKDAIDEPNFAKYPPLITTSSPSRQPERSLLLLNTNGRSATALSGSSEAAAVADFLERAVARQPPSTSALFGNHQDILSQSAGWNYLPPLPHQLGLPPTHLTTDLSHFPRSVERERQDASTDEEMEALSSFLLGRRSIPPLLPVYAQQSVSPLQSSAEDISSLLALQQRAQIDADIMEAGQQIMYRRAFEAQAEQGRALMVEEEQLRLQGQRRQQQQGVLSLHAGVASAALLDTSPPAASQRQQDRIWLPPLGPPPSAGWSALHRGALQQQQSTTMLSEQQWLLDNPQVFAPSLMARESEAGQTAKLPPK